MPGYILWQGPSRLNGEEVVLIATSPSVNDKTGDMVQYWIVPACNHPVENDEAVCSGCWFREQNICYVVTGHSVNNIWNKYHKGGYLEQEPELFRKLHAKPDRFGAWGDPSAVPARVWKQLARDELFTGYTQHWQKPQFQDMKHLCMASCHTKAQVTKAKELGWTPYYAYEPGGEYEGAIECPYYENKTTQCRECLLCNPAKGKIIQAPMHGSKAVSWIRSRTSGVGLS